jgi:hypothetical protein
VATEAPARPQSAEAALEGAGAARVKIANVAAKANELSIRWFGRGKVAAVSASACCGPSQGTGNALLWTLDGVAELATEERGHSYGGTPPSTAFEGRVDEIPDETMPTSLSEARAVLDASKTAITGPTTQKARLPAACQQCENE